MANSMWAYNFHYFVCVINVNYDATVNISFKLKYLEISGAKFMHGSDL